ncbi:MAG: protein kinase, partial [Elusimicrobiota bacterium]
MRRVLILALAAALPASALAEESEKIDDNAARAVELGRRASAKLKAGDRDGACADAKAARALSLDDSTLADLVQLACVSAAMPNKARYTPKKPLKKFESAGNAQASGAAPPQGVSAPAASPGSDPAAGGAISGGVVPGAVAGKDEKIDWYEAGPKLEAGVVVPEAPKPLDPAFEASAQATSAAEAKFGSGDFREAARLAGEAIEANPYNPRAFLVRGLALREKKQCRAAAADADAGLALKPNDMSLLKLRADSLNCAKDYKNALETAEIILSFNPTDAGATVMKAWALRGLGDREGMLAELKKAAALDLRFEYTLASAERMKDDPEAFFLLPGQLPPEKEAAGKKGAGLGKGARLLIAVGFGFLTFVGIMMGILQWVRSRSAPAQAQEPVPESSPEPESPDREPARPVEPPPPQTSMPRLVLSAPEPGKLASGAVLAGRYEVADLVGEGSTGAVYSAFDKRVGRVVALRRMRPELCGRTEERERFLGEAKKLALPNHPGIVALFDAFEEGEAAFLVVDYVDGKPLSRMVETGKRLSFADGLAVALQVCGALDCGHRAGVSHGDLKPGNILLDKRGGVRLSDFRLAALAKEALSRIGIEEDPKALIYRAPERYKGPGVPASDLYSFGLCLYEALTGAKPFSAGTLAEKTGSAPAPANSL